jgi:hypothetical protein
MTDEELRSIVHEKLHERGMSHIGISAHQYVVIDAVGDLVRSLVEREVQRLKWAGRDDG